MTPTPNLAEREAEQASALLLQSDGRPMSADGSSLGAREADKAAPTFTPVPLQSWSLWNRISRGDVGMSAPRLSKEIKDAIFIAYCTGRSGTAIAKKYGVDPSYPRILYRRRIASERRSMLAPNPKERETA